MRVWVVDCVARQQTADSFIHGYAAETRTPVEQSNCEREARSTSRQPLPPIIDSQAGSKDIIMNTLRLQLLADEHAAPGRIAPAGNADADASHARIGQAHG